MSSPRRQVYYRSNRNLNTLNPKPQSQQLLPSNPNTTKDQCNDKP